MSRSSSSLLWHVQRGDVLDDRFDTDLVVDGGIEL